MCSISVARAAKKQLNKRGEGREQIKILRTHLNRSLSEITKRLSIAIAVFSFTLMGAAFGINISRKRQYKSIYLAIFLTTLYLVSFFVAKGLDHHRFLASTLYLAPHALIIIASMIVLRRVTRGIE